MPLNKTKEERERGGNCCTGLFGGGGGGEVASRLSLFPPKHILVM